MVMRESLLWMRTKRRGQAEKCVKVKQSQMIPKPWAFSAILEWAQLINTDIPNIPVFGASVLEVQPMLKAPDLHNDT